MRAHPPSLHLCLPRQSVRGAVTLVGDRVALLRVDTPLAMPAGEERGGERRPSYSYYTVQQKFFCSGAVGRGIFKTNLSTGTFLTRMLKFCSVPRIQRWKYLIFR